MIALCLSLKQIVFQNPNWKPIITKQKPPTITTLNSYRISLKHLSYPHQNRLHPI